MPEKPVGEEPLWTVMIYLSGDNNLTEEMVLALKQLHRIQPSHQIKVVAQFDPSGLGVPTRRFDFSQSSGPTGDGRLEGSAVEEEITLGESNTGNPEALSDFITWAHERYPARNNFLILSGHGSGAEEDFLLKDESALDSLTIPELRWAICNAGVPIRILGLDNCLMSTAEVLHALSRHEVLQNGGKSCGGSPHVEIAIASEGFAPSQGWPYHRFLEAILADPGAYLDEARTVSEVVKLVVDGYGRFYSDYDFATGASADIAAVEVAEMGSVRDGVGALSLQLKGSLAQPAFVDRLLLAHWESQTYKFGQYVDLRDFCTRLRDRTKDDYPGVARACDSTIEAVKQCVIRSCCVGPRVQYSYGLSLYFPWAAIHDSYRHLPLPAETAWFDFLLEYLEQTRRTDRHHRPSRSPIRPRLLVPSREQQNVKEVFRKRKRPELGMTLGLGYLQGPGAPSSYAAERGGEKRYVKSRYVLSRFHAGDSDLQPVTQWIQNPPTSSGATCTARGENGGDDFSLDLG